MNYRPLRSGNLIRDELAVMIEKDLEFNGALVTITEVEVDKKLETAKVFVSVIPSSSAKEALEILKAAQGELQHQLLKKINIKPMPRIYFEIDHGPENAAKIEKIILESGSDA